MHDIRAIRENPAAFDAGLARRGLAPQSVDILALDEQRRSHIAALQKAQERRNAASKEVGAAMAAKDLQKAELLKAEVASLKDFLQSGEAEEKRLTAAVDDLLSRLPNIPADDVPSGVDETGNVERHTFGSPATFSFPAKQHFELGEALGLMDFETAAKMSGARFVILKGALARLERALTQFMLDLQTGEHGYTEINPPILVRDHVMFGTAQLPKFAEDQFKTTNDFWLIPTAEVVLTNMMREQVWEESLFPVRVTAATPCFRAEAGAAGRDTRGMIRQHQFTKVELVSVTTPEQSQQEHERMLACAEAVLKKLNLPYRVITLCTGDMGFSSRKTYDIEVWLPGQNAYREISSCSNCGDFQARRMGARYKSADGKNNIFLHTLNGSGLAVGRTLVAVMENYQQADGTIIIPDVLIPYMGGLKIIK